MSNAARPLHRISAAPRGESTEEMLGRWAVRNTQHVVSHTSHADALARVGLQYVSPHGYKQILLFTVYSSLRRNQEGISFYIIAQA